MPFLFLVFCLFLTDVSSASHATGWDQQKMLLAKASLDTGVSIVELAGVAALESSFNPDATASTSSAKGLFQFTNRTWRVTLANYGELYNLGSGVSRLNAYANTVMGAEYLKENRRILARRLNRTVSLTDVYMAHVIAPRRVVALDHVPQQTLIADLYPNLALANPNLFYNDDGGSKTITEFRAYFKDKVTNAIDQYGAVARLTFANFRDKLAADQFNSKLGIVVKVICYKTMVRNTILPVYNAQTTVGIHCDTITNRVPANQRFAYINLTADRRRIV